MDPFNLKASLRALAASKRQEPAPVSEEPRDPIQKLGSKIQTDIVKEAPPGLLERAGGTALSGLAIVGNALDVPGSMARDALTWLPGGPKPANPFDQLASPFTHENRTTGRDLLRGYGLAGKEDTAANFTTGLAAEIALDPLTYLTFGGSALTKGGRAARALNLEKQAADIATALRGRKVGAREARHIVTPRMILEKMNPRNRELYAERLRKDFGLQDKDLDRQLGGLARISMPFTDKPFTWNKKPITFWGLTDEDGVIGAGKVRGRGQDVMPAHLDVDPDAPPPASGGGSGSVPPDGGSPAPIAPKPSDPAPQPVAPQPTPPVAPVVNEVPPVQPIVNKAVVRQSPDSPNDMIIDLPGENSVQAIMRYASDADENPHIFLDQFVRQPKAAKGTGRKMLEEIVEATKDRNPASITGAFDDNTTLGAFASKFGKDNLVFRDRATGDIVDIPFSDVKANPSKYTATHYFKPEFKPQPKPTEVTSVDYSTGELAALRDAGYEADSIPRSYLEVSKDTGSSPGRLVAIDSAVNNLVDMVSKEGTPYLEAFDQIQHHVDFGLDGYGLNKATPKEIEYATRALSLIDRPPAIDDLIQYGKKQVQDVGKGKAIKEAERIWQKFGRMDMDEGAYYRAVVGKVPEPKKQQALIDDASEAVSPASDATVPHAIPSVKLNEPFVYNDRVMVITDVNGVKVPYYLSTGQGGKKTVPSGKWYPFFGVGSDNWINKGSEKNINEFYNSPYLKAKADELNSLLGSNYNVRQKDLPVAFDGTAKAPGDRRYVAANVNEGLSPVSHQDTIDNVQLHHNNIIDAVSRINKAAPPPAPIAAETAPIRIAGDDVQSILVDAESKIDQSLSPSQAEQAAAGLFDTLTPEARALFAEPEEFAKMVGATRRTARRRATPMPGLSKTRIQDTPEIEAAKAAAIEQKRGATIQQIVKAVENKYGTPSAEVARELINAASMKIPNETRAASALKLFEQLPPSELRLDNLLEFVRKQDVLSPEQIKFLDDMIPNKFRAKKGKLKSEVSEASVGGVPPTMVNLKTLEGLPEEAKPIVSDMINRIGQKLFDDVKLSVGGDAAKATTAGDIDMTTGFINIYNTAIKNKTVDRTTVHEFWHHLSKFLSADEVRAVRNEFEDSKSLFLKDGSKGELPYELSSVDEYFAHKLTDLSMKYLGRPKPEDLLGKVWYKALEAFERVWDAIRQTLGYDETKKIMSSFLDGHRAGAIKMSDSTLMERLADDLEPGNVLKSQADPVLSSEEIARQLNEATSSKIAKGMDTIGASILDSALGRQMTALFDQSVLGQLSKEGQEAAKKAFVGGREAIAKERSFMSRFLRTWYDTEGVREDIIANTELRPLGDYEVQFKGDKKAAADARLRDARVIQNGRTNDLRRLLERPLWTPEGQIDADALLVTPEQLPDWVGKKIVNGQVQVDGAARQQMANMLSEFRKKALKMITREWFYGINTSRIDGYYPRILSEMPGASRSLWNPNYGRLLDPTHPHQKPRDSYLVGYTDNSSVINDLSVDPEFSGIHAAKKVREELTNAEVNKVAEKVWEKYAPRLSEADAALSWTELGRASDASRMMQKKVTDLTRKIMTIDPAHAKHQIPLFSNDLFSAMELRLEHHHRSIMHAQAIRNILEKNTFAKNLADGESVVVANVLKGSKYDSKKAGDVVRSAIPKEQLLEADRNFWNTEIAARAQLMDEINSANATRTGEPLTYKDPGGRPYQHSIDRNGLNTLILPDYIEKASAKNTNRHDLVITWTDGDSSSIVARWDEIIPMEKDSTTAFTVIPDPKNARLSRTYDSPHPNAVIFEQVAVPIEVGKAITKFVKGPKVLDEVRPVVRAYDKFTNMWKMLQTGMLPFLSFHGRNLGSGQASNLYLGIQKDPRFASLGLDPKTWLNPVKSFTAPIGDAHKISTGQTIPGISQAPMFRGKNLTDDQATEELRKVAYALAVVGEKQGISAEQLMDTVGTAATQYPGIDAARAVNPLAWKWSDPVPESTFAQRWLMPWMSKGVLSDKDIFRPGQLGRDLGSYTENLNRLSPFIAMIRQGYDPRAAADLVNRAQVDYTSMSNFNREYTRRLFPFASYTLGMAPTVTRELLERPGGGMARTVMATTQAGQTAEQGVTPDYIRETASIPLGMSEDGTRSYITGFGLPFEDPLQFAQLGKGNVSGLLRELGSRMNPIPKALIEVMTGRSLYQAGPFGGREIEDLDPTIGRIIANVNDLVTGEKTERAEPFMGSPWVEYGISNAGPGRMLNTIRTATDPRKWDVVPWKLLLNLGTGVRVADVSPSAQDAILRERLAKVMKDFGGRMYTRPYFPDYAEEKWTPEEAADAAKIDALLKLLGQRAKDRRVE